MALERYVGIAHFYSRSLRNLIEIHGAFLSLLDGTQGWFFLSTFDPWRGSGWVGPDLKEPPVTTRLLSFCRMRTPKGLRMFQVNQISGGPTRFGTSFRAEPTRVGPTDPWLLIDVVFSLWRDAFA